MTHKQNHKKNNNNKTHTHTLKNNKEEKHTCNNKMDGGFDNTFYYKQNQLK